MKDFIIKNKKGLVITLISIIILTTVIGLFIILKSSNKKNPENIETEELTVSNDITENTQDETIENTQEETIQSEDPLISEETKETEDIVSNESNQKKSESKTTTKTTTQTTSTQQNNSNNKQTSSNKQSSTSSSSSSTSTPTSTPSSSTATSQRTETYKENTTYENKLVSAVKKYASQNDLCSEYGYNVSINKNAMNYCSQFTYSESNVSSIVINGGTKYQVYARDYFVNGEYQWTECYCASVP